MKICTALLWFLLLGLLPAQAQDDSQHTSTEQQTAQQPTLPASTASVGQLKIEPAKAADIRRLLDLTGVNALITQTMDAMEKTIKPLVVNSFPPGEYRKKLIDLFFERFRSKADPHHFLDLAVPIYDKYLSHEEIKGLIQFYETPLGQKTLSVLPRLSGELRDEGKKWGEGLGRESMREVLSEHPELVEALKGAKEPTQP